MPQCSTGQPWLPRPPPAVDLLHAADHHPRPVEQLRVAADVVPHRPPLLAAADRRHQPQLEVVVGEGLVVTVQGVVGLAGDVDVQIAVVVHIGERGRVALVVVAELGAPPAVPLVVVVVGAHVGDEQVDGAVVVQIAAGAPQRLGARHLRGDPERREGPRRRVPVEEAAGVQGGARVGPVHLVQAVPIDIAGEHGALLRVVVDRVEGEGGLEDEPPGVVEVGVAALGVPPQDEIDVAVEIEVAREEEVGGLDGQIHHLGEGEPRGAVVVRHQVVLFGVGQEQIEIAVEIEVEQRDGLGPAVARLPQIGWLPRPHGVAEPARAVVEPDLGARRLRSDQIDPPVVVQVPGEQAAGVEVPAGRAGQSHHAIGRLVDEGQARPGVDEQGGAPPR